MTPTNQSSPRKFTLVHLFLGAIVILLVIIVVRSFFPRDPDGGGSGTKPATADQSNPMPPLLAESRPTKVDTTLLQQTYKVGKSYHATVTVSLTSRGTSKDWGIALANNFAYVGEVVMDRTIESNDGTKIVMTQTFPEATTLTAVTQVEGIRIELPPAGMCMLEGLGHASTVVTHVPLQFGWSAVTVASTNAVLENPMAKSLIAAASRDPKAQAFRFIDSIEGKQMKVEFINGRGVTDIKPLGVGLTPREVDFVRLMNCSSDATILPQNSKPGDSWTIRAADLMTLLDPSTNAVPSGTVTAQRLADQTVGGRTVARIEIIKGVLDMVDTTKKNVTKATWAPRGILLFDTKDSIITSAELDGELIIQNHSADHIIFEASWSQQPKYKVVYHCELRK